MSDACLYRLEPAYSGAGFRVFSRRPVQLQETVVTRDGRAESRTRDYAEIFCCPEPSILDCWLQGKENWRVDCMAGVQRWRGSKTTSQVRAALKRLGFSLQRVKKLFADCRNSRRQGKNCWSQELEGDL